LANQRGENVPRHGKWNVVCGFIDYGETLEHAAARECLEECGIKINSRILRNCGTNSKREVINTRFFGILPGITDNYPPSIDNCEGFGTDRQEVINAKWIPLSKLSEFNFVNGQIDSANDLAENMLPQSEFSNSSKFYKDFFYSLEKLRTTGMLDSEKYNKIMAIINGKL
jgi:ADP-ribose pyrophosphatase YjhB (NUDIX family)